jgi:hypothetical protein
MATPQFFTMASGRQQHAARKSLRVYMHQDLPRPAHIHQV